jgi:hypothetical protein
MSDESDRHHQFFVFIASCTNLKQVNLSNTELLLEWNLLHALTAACGDMGLGLDGQAWQCTYRAS